MKKFIVMTLLLNVFAAHLTFAQSQTTNVACDEEYSVVPCIVSDKKTAASLANMLFENSDAFTAVRNKARNGYRVAKVRLTAVDFEPTASPAKAVWKYEILLKDCNGSDPCQIRSLWTVVKTQTIKNYETANVFSDTLTEAQDLPKNP